jgi:hypothetical protein
MLDIPFPLETVPADQADTALKELIADRDGVMPVLLGDRDVFSTEWAEYVDVFENPKEILAEARALDSEMWFANRIARKHPRRVELGAPRWIAGVVSIPKRVMGRLGSGDAESEAHDAQKPTLVSVLKTQLAELERAGESTEDELSEMREVIAEIEADGTEGLFPDPIDYVKPRSGTELAAGLVNAAEPWEAAAWLQHGAYAVCAPKAALVAHCRWLWTTYGARIITASTDHIGFQMDRLILNRDEATDVMRRFEILGATAINGDLIDTDGDSLIHADRLWVGWD